MILEPERSHYPKWIFNYSLGKTCPWKHIPAQVVPPACIPPTLGQIPMAIEITGPPEPIVESSLKKGHYLTVPQLNNIMTELEIETSAKGKLQLAEALITSLFPNVSKEEHDFMVASIMKRRVVTREESADLLLKLTSMLDTSEAQQFDKMRKSAVDELATKTMKERVKQRVEEGKRKAEEGNPASGSKKRPGDGGADEEPPKKKIKVDDIEKELGRRNVKAPPEFLQYFPLVSQCYFKWQPQNERVGVEFVQQERF